MATGAQPAHTQKRCSRLTGLCGALMERQVFRRKDVFSGTHCPFVFIPHRSEPLALSFLSPSPANRLFSSLSSAWEGVFFFLTCAPKGLQERPQLEPSKTPMSPPGQPCPSRPTPTQNRELSGQLPRVEHQALWAPCKHFLHNTGK